jgi:hypothetical protein
MLSGEEPRRQKTRGPERGGIIREVSPKKIGKERNAQGQEASEYRADPDRESVRFEAMTAVHDSVRIGMMNRTRRKRKV